MRRGALFLVLAALLSGPAEPTALGAQTPGGADPHRVETALDGFRWRNLGPLRGGRSIAAAGSVARPHEYWFGAMGGGLWKSTDGGTTWAPVSDGDFGSASVGAVGVCPADPDVVYAGTGEVDFRGTMSTGDGVYRTRDGGRSWSHVGLGSETGQQAVSRIRVHPDDCGTLWVAVLGDPYGPNETRGVYRSADGGDSWERVLHRSDRAGAADLALSPHDPDVLFATVWDVVRKPWGGVTGDESGIFRTTDGGDSWTEITRNPGLPEVSIGKVGIDVSGGDADRIYAVVEAEMGHGGLYRSDDGGDTWTHTSAHHSLYARSEYYTKVVADPVDPDRAYVLVPYFFRTDDGGFTFTQLESPHGDHHDLWIDPADPDRMIEANDGGANVSLNGGRTWTGQDYSTAQIYHVTTTNEFPYMVCGAQQDNSTACVPSDGDGSYWEHVAGGESGYIAVRPDDPDVVYAGSYRGYITRYDRGTGQARNIEVWPVNPQGEPAAGQRERFQWTFPIVLSPLDPDVLYVASQHVFRSTDEGGSWERISPDLTRAEPETIRGSGLIIRDQNSQDYYATIFALAPSKRDPDVIWAGSDDGLVHVTTDGGRAWSDVTPDGMPDFARVSMIEASPHAPGKALVAVERYKLQDVSPYVFRTADHGRTWSRVTDGIPEGHFVRAIREDPERPGLLVAGTEHAPYVSMDDGGNWEPISLNLPDVQVSDLTVKGADLVISTYGRGMYVLDDAMTVLRQWEPGTTATTLFPPADVIQTRASVTKGDGRNIYRRTLMPGANRALAHYRLEAAAEWVEVAFLDAGGRVIRSYRAGPDVTPKAPMRDSVGHVINGPRWGQEIPPVPARSPGIHAIAWNLRHPSVSAFPGMLIRGGGRGLGPLVPPGEYRVRLRVDGREWEEPFRVEMDPRLVDVTRDDLVARHELSLGIYRRLEEVTSTMIRLRERAAELDERRARTSDADVARRLQEARNDIMEVYRDLYPVEARGQKDPLHLGGRLVNKVASLLHHTVESADARPTKQSYEAFDVLSGEVDEALARARRVLAEDAPRLDAAPGRDSGPRDESEEGGDHERDR